MSDHDRTGLPDWPEGVIAVRVGPGANCSSMGSSIQLLWAATVLGGVIAVVASALVGPRESPPLQKKREEDQERGSPDEPAST